MKRTGQIREPTRRDPGGAEHTLQNPENQHRGSAKFEDFTNLLLLLLLLFFRRPRTLRLCGRELPAQKLTSVRTGSEDLIVYECSAEDLLLLPVSAVVFCAYVCVGF
ncbi:hypothetical protein ILYODFUR_030820 [Ilyodon furcidens]|uniref:Uncharacterized protein n=1 Tax=Ilyodon furcidens TaxID=33524 RepID=A0ABV0T336_9TELE